MSIIGNMVGAYSTIGKMLIVEDENGNELTGVITDKEVIFTADAREDIREGKVAATGEGVVTGSKYISQYYTTFGQCTIASGASYEIILSEQDVYDYTYLQCLICAADGVTTTHVVIDDKVYAVNSTDVVSTITKDVENKKVILGMTNDTGSDSIIRYFACKNID